MTTKELIAQADRILDSRNLAEPQIRKRAVRKIVSFMEATGSFMKGDQVDLPADKKVLKQAVIQYFGKEPFSANGAINIMYDVIRPKINYSAFFSSIEDIKDKPLPPAPKPWYKNSNTWAWIITGISIVVCIIVLVLSNAS